MRLKLVRLFLMALSFAESGAHGREPNELPMVTEVAFVVPVYRELENGNIKAFLNRLDRIASETDRPRGLAVRAVFAVNNTTEVAADPQSKVYLENLRTLQYLQKEEKKRSFQITIVDLATRGTARNMGIIRETAVQTLLKESKAPREQLVLVHMDSDTKLPAHFLADLTRAYGRSQEAVFFARSYELRHEVHTALIKSHPDYKRKRAWRDLQILLGELREGLATYQISSRASTHLNVGGFKPVAQAEDTRLTQDLLAFPHVLDATISVTTEDRSRPDGFTSARRSDGLAAPAPIKKPFPRLLFLEPWIQRAEERVQQNLMTSATADRAFEALVLSQFGVDIAPIAQAGAGVRERYKTFLYERSESPARTAYHTWVDLLPAVEKSFFDLRVQKEVAQLKQTELQRQRSLNLILRGDRTAHATSDPFLRWVNREGIAELRPYFQNGELDLEKLRSEEPALADWISPADPRSVFRETAVLVALYSGLSEIIKTPRLAPQSAAVLRKLQEGPK